MSLYEEGKSYFPLNIDSAMLVLDEALSLADSLNFFKGQTACYRAFSGIEAYRGNFDQSISWIDKGLKLVERHDLPPIFKIDFLINKGVALTRAEQLGSALESYLVAETLARANGFGKKRGILLNNIGVIYRRLKRYDEAVRIYQQGISLRSSMKDTLGLANTFFNLSATEAIAMNYDEAVAASSKARKLYKALGSEIDLIQTDLALGDVFFKMGKEDEAYKILAPMALKKDLNLPLHDRTALHTILATYYNRRQLYEDAAEELETVEKELIGSDLNNFKLDYFLQRSIAAKGVGQLSEAYLFLNKHLELRKNISEIESEEFRREAEIKYLTKEKDWKLQVQELEIQKNNRQRVLFGLGSISLALISLLLWKVNSSRQKTNRLLSDKNKIIQSALDEKEILLREIHHRVKNNLQFISSLLGLQTEHTDDPSALGALQEGQDRVQSMALIHQNLYQEDNLKGVDVKDYFIKLIRGLFDSYNVRKDQVKLTLNIDDLNLDVDSVVPIGLIVNELVSNSLKYAFPNEMNGNISVSLTEVGEGLQLNVSDNGVGMDDHIEEKLGKSFGYRLVNVLKEQLHADLRIENKGGTRVTIRIQKYQKTG